MQQTKNEKRFYLIDHKWLFLAGFIFYLIVPIIVGKIEIFKGYPGMDLYLDFFKQIPPGKIKIYLLICFGWLLSFYLGHFVYKFINPIKRSLPAFKDGFADYGIRYVGFFLCFLLIIFSFIARNSIFGGYHTYDVGARGKLSTLLVIFNFFILYQLLSEEKVPVSLLVGLLCSCVLLLSMGGRMYVFQTFIALLVYKTSFAKKRWSLLKMSGAMLAGFFVGSAAGIWRLGSAFSLQKAAYSFGAEPVFTWISTSTFLTSNELPLFNVPLNFITSFLNLVPNSFISFKQYIVSAPMLSN